MQCVVAVFPDGVRTALAFEKLTAGGFPRQNVSMVARSMTGVESEVKRAVQFGDDTERDAVMGAGIGGIVGVLGGSGFTLAAGVMVVAGPLVALTGAIVGGLVGAIAGWGVHHDRATEYQKKVEAGKVLLIAHSDDPQQVAKAEELLRLTNPEELHLHSRIDDGDDPHVDAKASGRLHKNDLEHAASRNG